MGGSLVWDAAWVAVGGGLALGTVFVAPPTVDRGPFSYESLLNIRTCERIFEPDGTKAVRGGSFMESPRYARSAAREQVAEGQRSVDLGLRASRAIEE
jgi:hypothetical protein